MMLEMDFKRNNKCLQKLSAISQGGAKILTTLYSASIKFKTTEKWLNKKCLKQAN